MVLSTIPRSATFVPESRRPFVNLLQNGLGLRGDAVVACWLKGRSDISMVGAPVLRNSTMSQHRSVNASITIVTLGRPIGQFNEPPWCG